MNSRIKSLKMWSIVAAAGALAVMGTVTLVEGASDSTGTGPQIVADTPTGSTPATTPSVPSAVPAVKATKFVGGDWTGI
jgi:hypothetical protein